MKKFLEFNGKPICFVSLDGTWWVAIKPICEALNVDYKHQAKMLKKDKILNGVSCDQTMHDSSGRLQKMTSLPEKYIYGWLFSINSSSEDLLKYKLVCYDILFDHFHGAITQRENLLVDKIKTHQEAEQLEKSLMQNEDYKRLMELKAKEMRVGKSLKLMDTNLIAQQTDLFQTKKQ